VEPNSDDERRFRRTHISKHDFRRAGEFVRAAREHEISTIEHEALLIAAIIYYARPFSGNEKDRKKHQPPPPSDARLHESLANFEEGEDQILHDRIVKLRHKAVAHAEFGNYPVMLMGEEQRTIVSSAWHVIAEQLDLARLKKIANDMQTRSTLGVYEDVMLRDA
jgi:hypothetical protein